MTLFDRFKPITTAEKTLRAASSWAVRIDDRELTEKEHRRFKKWLLQSPEHEREFLIATQFGLFLREMAQSQRDKLRQQATGAVQLQTVIDRIEKVPEGHLIEVAMIPWFAIYREIHRNPWFMHQLTPLQLEEMIAGAYKLAGFPSVTITPRSGDRGRDVIATSRDGYTVRILDQAKKYAPNKIIGYDAIRAFIMVLDADRATRGFLTTTGAFPPNLLQDHLIAPRLGSTLELVDGANLGKRLAELAYGTGAHNGYASFDNSGPSRDGDQTAHCCHCPANPSHGTAGRRLIIDGTLPPAAPCRGKCRNLRSVEMQSAPLRVNRGTGS